MYDILKLCTVLKVGEKVSKKRDGEKQVRILLWISQVKTLIYLNRPIGGLAYGTPVIHIKSLLYKMIREVQYPQ